MARDSGRADDAAPEVRRLLAGRHCEDHGYRTVRSSGTSDWLLMYTAAGGGRIRVEGRPDIRTGPGSICVITPGTPHDYGTDPHADGWTLVWAHIHPRPEWLPLLNWPQVAPGIRLLELPGTIGSRVDDALGRAGSYSRGGMKRADLFGLNAVEEALLWCDTQNPQGDQVDPRVLAVLEHVGDHLERPHSVASLATVAGLSPSRLSHLFAEQLGIGVMAHVEWRRMELARELLDLTSFPVAEIARRAGYDDPLYFSKRFRYATGRSPTTYRDDPAGFNRDEGSGRQDAPEPGGSRSR